MQNSHKIGSLTSSQWEALIDVLQRSRFDEKWNIKNGTWQLQYFDYLPPNLFLGLINHQKGWKIQKYTLWIFMKQEW